MRLTGVQVLGTPDSRQGTALLAAAAAAAAAADPRASDVQPAQAPSQVCWCPPAPPKISPQTSAAHLQRPSCSCCVCTDLHHSIDSLVLKP